MNYGFKTSDMKHFGTAPGIGIVIQTGKYQGRILVPLYYNSNSFSGMSGAVLYSDDNGATWHLGESPNAVSYTHLDVYKRQRADCLPPWSG